MRSAERIGVSRALVYGIENESENGVAREEDIRVPDSRHVRSAASQILLPYRVAKTAGVLTAIKLNNELGLVAGKIGHEPADSHGPPKLVSA